MGGMTMWIILGTLIGVVICFLIVSGILDRKKRKKIQEEEKIILEKSMIAKDHLIIFISELIKFNKKMLKDFLPSVGKLKMSDIVNRASKELKDLKNKTFYRQIADPELKSKYNKLVQLFLLERSNNWEKRLKPEISEINKMAESIKGTENFKKQKQEVIKYLKGKYQ